MGIQPDKFSETEKFGNMQEVAAQADSVVSSTLQKVETMKEVVGKGTASGGIFADQKAGKIGQCVDALKTLQGQTAEVRQALTTGPTVSGAPAGLTR